MQKSNNYRPIGALIGSLAALLLLGGCSEKPDALTLDIDGQTVVLPLEKMDVYLVDPDFEDEYPESFEILGPDVVLVGKFPMKTRVGYGEKFDRLSGQSISIARETKDAREPKRSSLVLPGGQALVEGGAFVVDEVGEGYDAKTPVSGTVSLKLRTRDGEKTVNGTFKVKGTTWG